MLGPLAVSEGAVREIAFGEGNPVAHWKPLFDAGTKPQPAADAYPPFDELLRTYRELRAANRRLLDELDDAGLDQLSKAPPAGAEEVFRTIGQTLLVTAMHQSFHCGQVADARQAAGRKPLLM